MKITAINTQNFLGARAIDVRLDKPIALFAGANGAGKSSLRDAVALALTADLGRVSLKKDAPGLITAGAEAAVIEISTDQHTYAVAINAAGKISDSMAGRETPAALQYVLDAQRFARLEPNDRRAFLFGLMGLKTDGAAVKQRLTARGCDAAKVEQVAPILRAGFDAAAKEAQAKARECKAQWKMIAGGEQWGKDKAAKWQPAALPAEADHAESLLANARAQGAEVEKQLGSAQQELGAAKAEHQRRHLAAAQRAELAERAGRIDRIKSKLAHDEAELKEWEQKVAVLQGSAKSQDAVSCPDCGVMLVMKDGALVHAAPMAKGTEDDIAKLPEYEKALHLLQSAVAHGKRDLAAAEQAAAKLSELDKEAAEAIDIEPLQAKVTDLTAKRDAWRADADKYRAIAEQATRRQAVIDQAAKLHSDVLAWTDVADALAPDGIPGELLAEALGPINRRIAQSADFAKWAETAIGADMSITLDGRAYVLCSESEKWRADALIAEAIAYLSGVKLLVLDRVDVLDLTGRADLVEWLSEWAGLGEIETALLFATLKGLPADLPRDVEAHWIERGVT